MKVLLLVVTIIDNISLLFVVNDNKETSKSTVLLSALPLSL